MIYLQNPTHDSGRNRIPYRIRDHCNAALKQTFGEHKKQCHPCNGWNWRKHAKNRCNPISRFSGASCWDTSQQSDQHPPKVTGKQQLERISGAVKKNAPIQNQLCKKPIRTWKHGRTKDACFLCQNVQHKKNQKNSRIPRRTVFEASSIQSCFGWITVLKSGRRTSGCR